MANYDNPNGFKFETSLIAGSNIPVTVRRTVATGQTIAKGDAVIAASGLVQIALANSPTILGVAAESCTSAAAGTQIDIYPAVPWNVFSAQCESTYSAALRYAKRDIIGATGVMEVDEDAHATEVLTIIGEVGDPNNSIGANTRVLVVFTKSQFLGMEAAHA